MIVSIVSEFRMMLGSAGIFPWINSMSLAMSCRNISNYLSKKTCLSLQNRVGTLLPIIASANYCSSKAGKIIPGLPKNSIEELNSSTQQSANGEIYDKKPFKFSCVKGKKYAWCLCGKSKSQPFCDGTHRNPHLKISLRPVHFVMEEDKEVWLCNCKQTSKRPFCDGTHKREDIQAAVR